MLGLEYTHSTSDFPSKNLPDFVHNKIYFFVSPVYILSLFAGFVCSKHYHQLLRKLTRVCTASEIIQITMEKKYGIINSPTGHYFNCDRFFLWVGMSLFYWRTVIIDRFIGHYFSDICYIFIVEYRQNVSLLKNRGFTLYII